MDLNKVQIIGRVTQDPEVRTTPSGVSVVSFSVATNLIWTNPNGEKQEKTEFHNVVAWRRLAEICGQYLSKGRQVYIEGRLQTRSWEGQDGVRRYRTEIIADNMIMLGSPAGIKEVEEMPPPPSETPATKETEETKEEPLIEEVPEEKEEETKSLPETPKEEEGPKKEDKGDEIKIEDMPF